MSATTLDLHVHLEPIVDLTSGALDARELLLRPVGGGALPARAALARVTMSWVTSYALRAATAVLETSSVPIHVNITAADLSDPCFVDAVDEIVDADLQPKLVLEVTEHAELIDSRVVRSTLSALRARGVRFAIDDFGDGWAGEASVGVVLPEVVKARRQQLELRSTARALHRIAFELHVPIVIEQVETAHHLELVRRQGFPLGQGWYWDDRGEAVGAS
jgi:EAL domain-containing protein (putative c-di-GMP-specific phosphodiesterase class I)